MSNILTAQELRNYKDLGQKIDEPKMTPVIEAAQYEVKDLMGSPFYFDMMANLDNPTYQDLLSGCTFTPWTYPQLTFQHEGVKALLADHFMAKYILVLNTNIMPFGATLKVNENGQPADRNALKDISTQQLQMAGYKWEMIKLYLDSNRETFPIWRNNIYSPSEALPNERKFRIRKL